MTVSQPPVAISSDNTVLALDPPRVLGATRPVVGADIGVSLVIYDLVNDGLGATVEVDPPLVGTVNPNDVIELWLEGETTFLDSEIIVDVNAKTMLRIPKGRLHPDRVNELFYIIRRGSDNRGTSDPLSLLYNKIRPGLKDTKPEVDGHSELALLLPDAIKNGVGADFVSAQVCVSYPYCRAYDTITLKCNGEIMSHMVGQNEAPQPPNPGSPNPITVCFTVGRAYLDSAVRPSGKLDFSYTVTDQLGNTPDTDAVWSASQTADEDLAGTRLPEPILREIQNDPTDDPGIIDLEKLGNNPLLLIVLTSDPRFDLGDALSATYTAKVDGQPDVVVTVTGNVEADEFGQKKPCVLQVANDKVIVGSLVTATYQLLKGGTPAGTSKEATARVVGKSAIELNPPTLPSAPNPFHPLNYPQGVSVRIDHAGAVPGDKARLFLLNPLPESPAFVDLPLDQKFALFTLDATFLGLWHGKVPQLAWKLIKGGQPVAESKPLMVAVNRIANDDPRLSKPTIDGAAGDGVLDVAQMQDSAQLRVAAWLLQVSRHCIWLRYDGFDKQGVTTEWVVWAGAPHASTSGVTTAAAIAWLRTLKDGSRLTITFGVSFEKKADAATMVRFPVQVYTIRAVELVIPGIDSVTDSKGVEIVNGGTTVDEILTLKGIASQGQTIQLYDGTTPVGPVVLVRADGEWEQTLRNLAEGAHSFTAKALYGAGEASASWKVTVVAVETPKITSAKDGHNNTIDEGGTTVDIAVTLSGTATPGQLVEIFEGGDSKGTAPVEASRIWIKPVSIQRLGMHNFTVKGLYGDNPVSSPPWRLTAAAAERPVIERALTEQPILMSVPKDHATASTILRLEGTASDGREVEVFDGKESMGIVKAENGIWTIRLSGLSLATHTFIVRARYGQDAESLPYTIIVASPVARPTITNASWNGAIPPGSNYNGIYVNWSGTVATAPYPRMAFLGNASGGGYGGTVFPGGGTWARQGIYATNDRPYSRNFVLSDALALQQSIPHPIRFV